MGMGAATGATRQAVNNVKPIQGGVPPQGGKGGVYQPMPGSTVPPQGGKGGAQQPGQPPYLPTGLPPAQPPIQPPIQPTVPARREGLGQMFPNYTFPQVQPPPPPRSPSIPTPRPQVQPPMPPQGGKGGVYQPMPGQVPAQGGKGRDFGPNVFPGPQQPQVLPPQGGFPQQPINSGMPPDLAAKYAEMERMKAGQVPGFPHQPGQVPAQGGKAPFTPEQQAAFGPYINTRPMPQVLPPQGGFPQQPQVMPRPAPMQPQGLAQIQQFLKQQEMLRGRR